jgi:hypothetical protein
MILWALCQETIRRKEKLRKTFVGKTARGVKVSLLSPFCKKLNILFISKNSIDRILDLKRYFFLPQRGRSSLETNDPPDLVKDSRKRRKKMVPIPIRGGLEDGAITITPPSVVVVPSVAPRESDDSCSSSSDDDDDDETDSDCTDSSEEETIPHIESSKV